jgi:DNA polymerase-3 subunit gamma/tau
MSEERKEFELKYRPLSFDELIGWETEKKSLLSMIKTKRSFLLYGSRGCGKTTIGRLIAYELDIDDLDIIEIDAASNTGVDDARTIKSNASLYPLKGKNKIYIIDEVHRLSGNAFDALLKTIEEPPQHCYFVLCSSEIDKIPATIKSRCAKYEVKPLNQRDSSTLLNWICREEKLNVNNNIIQAIIDHCEGVPREMVISLDMVKDISNEQEAISLLYSKENKEIIDLCWALLNKDSWSKICSILKELKEEPEQIRYSILGVMNSILMKDTKQQEKAAMIMLNFMDTFIYTKRAGLSLACYMSIKGD